jgi:two-component system, chemotaxis family, sensor kinase CheA
MNDFLRQFLIESRELVAQASDGLLLLEQSPANAECIDSVFRAFHTLKGGASIVEFAAMERVVHSAEDRLVQVRSGRRTLDPGLAGECLACLDQVSAWLDILERTGELPADRDRKADMAIDPPGTLDSPADEIRSAAGMRVPQNWTASLLSRNSSVRGTAVTAIRFVPDGDCFYRGEDPVARMSALPRLLALDLEPVSAWPPLGDLDPYSCNLVLTALTGSSVNDVSAHMQGHSGDCEIVAVSATAVSRMEGPLPKNVRKILEEQVAILDVEKVQHLPGRIASAGITAANTMQYCGRHDHAEALQRAFGSGVGEHARVSLRDAIMRLLASDSGAPAQKAEPSQPPETITRTLRVDAGRIDSLVRLTGELTVAKNAMGHTAKLAQANGDSVAGLLKEQHGALERLIAQLQGSVIGMRVLPLRSVFQRFPRVLREMASSLGKAAKLEIEGEDTEADKTIIEMLFEPLLHIVRNAIDHGVEDANERLKRGKPSVATIHLRAAREANQVLIEVADDGGGIDVELVREVARSRGVATETDLSTMAEADVIDLVFAPGFSTAAKVTEISGRGVGMDAVRKAVEKVGGRVSIASRAGQGTTVSFSLPFSVLMTQVMTVEAGGQAFGIPVDAIVETVRVASEGISGVGDARVIVHRNRTIPVLELGTVLDGSQKRTTCEEIHATVVIAAVAGQWVGIQVDRPGERMEVILKPLEGLLSGTSGIAGTTLLGDGRILLVLDIAELLQ